VQNLLESAGAVSMFQDLECDALGDLDAGLSDRKGLGLVMKRAVLFLHFFAEAAFHFEIFVDCGKGVGHFPHFFGRLVFLSERAATAEMGSNSFWISLYSLILTIRSKLSSISLLVFFLLCLSLTFSGAC
jgi:hypothetical protein